MYMYVKTYAYNTKLNMYEYYPYIENIYIIFLLQGPIYTIHLSQILLATIRTFPNPLNSFIFFSSKQLK